MTDKAQMQTRGDGDTVVAQKVLRGVWYRQAGTLTLPGGKAQMVGCRHQAATYRASATAPGRGAAGAAVVASTATSGWHRMQCRRRLWNRAIGCRQRWRCLGSEAAGRWRVTRQSPGCGRGWWACSGWRGC